jgi:hypothetical protein
MFHVRADMDDEEAARLARAFGTNLIMAGEGSSGCFIGKRRMTVSRQSPSRWVKRIASSES